MRMLPKVALATLCASVLASAQAAGLGAPRGDVYDASGRRVGPFLAATPLGEAAFAKVAGQLIVLPLSQVQVPDTSGTLVPRLVPRDGGATSVHYDQADCTGNAWIRLVNIVGGTMPAAIDGPSSALKVNIGKFPMATFSALSEFASGTCRISMIESQGYPVVQRLEVSDLFALPLSLR